MSLRDLFGRRQQAILEQVMQHLALQGPSFPEDVHAAGIGGSSAVYLSLRTLFDENWIVRIQDPTHQEPARSVGGKAFRHYYMLSSDGWTELQRRTAPTGGWTVELQNRRREQSDLPYTPVHKTKSA